MRMMTMMMIRVKNEINYNFKALIYKKNTIFDILKIRARPVGWQSDHAPTITSSPNTRNFMKNEAL